MMGKYRKNAPPVTDKAWLLGMLYIVSVRLVVKATGEKIKHNILMVGCESDDIERKLRWVFDPSLYMEFSVSGVEKVKEKIHILSTVITQDKAPALAIIARENGTQEVAYPTNRIEQYDPKLYAVGIATTILAKDEEHALRKVGYAITNSVGEHSHSGAKLSTDSTVTVEEIPRSSGYAMPRDVSNETNEASFVRG